MPAWRDAEARRHVFEVVRELAVTDFRLKYYDSLLGYVWSMLSPLLMLVIYFFVFRYIVGVRTPGYLAYLLVGLLYWTFFQDCTFSGLTALVGKAELLKGLPLPGVLVVAAGASSTMITITINTGVLVIGLAMAGRLSYLAPLALLPIGCLLALASGVAFLVALSYVRFRDTGIIWGVLLQAWFWLTPVVYTVPEGPIADLLSLNPLARCLFLIRWFLLYDYLPSMRFLLLTVVMCAGTFAAGIALFLRHQRSIPERL